MKIPKRTYMFWAGLVLLVTVAVYIPAILSGYIWDDDVHVTDNFSLRTVEGLGRIWLEPKPHRNTIP
jgi:hypothetical protein